MTLDGKSLYQNVILDHAKNPRNEGKLEDATHQATVDNPLCGDRITLRLVIESGVVRNVRFEARGCMIARASASLLTEAIAGMTTSDALACIAKVEALTSPNAAKIAGLGILEPLAGARDFPARRPCVLLAWQALEKSI